MAALADGIDFIADLVSDMTSGPQCAFPGKHESHDIQRDLDHVLNIVFARFVCAFEGLQVQSSHLSRKLFSVYYQRFFRGVGSA